LALKLEDGGPLTIMEFARTMEAMGFGFGVASVVIIFQAYFSRKHKFLLFYGISFSLGLLHLALIELPTLLNFPIEPSVFLAKYIHVISTVPLVAVYFFLKAVDSVTDHGHFRRFRLTYAVVMCAVLAHLVFRAIVGRSVAVATSISWIHYNLIVVVQVVFCAVMIRRASGFAKDKKTAIQSFGIYYLANILISMALNYSWRYRVLDHQTYINLYFFFAFLIDAAPLVFLRWFLKRYESSSFRYGEDDKVSDEFVQHFAITPREREIIDLICAGKTNKEIGDILFISHQTVKDHVYKIFRKTGVKNRISLANLTKKPIP
jgi:DNA-binding CsgD family transcriptional regulator